MKTYDKNDPDSIQSLFNSIAKNYDKTNGILSFQMQKRWNTSLVDQVIIPSRPKVLLDLCCGTGAIAFEYLRKTSHSAKVYMLDFSEQMLAYAKAQAEHLQLNNHAITYLQADAQKIPLTSKSVSCATMAYGIRNVRDPQSCIKDIYRVLEPGGVFGILELTQPKNPVMRLGHGLYLSKILPLLGKLFTSNEEAYQYLCNSIKTFIPPEDLENLMVAEGFINTRRQSFFSGVATLIIGRKPH
jgi:demethylmenaquinone methyltransferase/2-methoxy-6-polyprenyl-1,4-benzoquinol methylase